MSQGFEDRAADWIRFAGAERHDAYWAYRDAFFELLPASPATTLEVGYGEGRVPRDLRALGHDVTGLDASPTLVGAARDADPGGTYVVGDALALPFGDGAFDLVVAYNSLIDVEDMPVAVAGAGRVLRPGGCFCLRAASVLGGGRVRAAMPAPRSSSRARTSRRPATSS